VSLTVAPLGKGASSNNEKGMVDNKVAPPN